MRNFLVSVLPTQPSLDGRFDQVTPITATGGGGQFSAVFKARHVATDAPVALKFLIPNVDSYRAEAFKREGQLLNTTLRDEPLFVQLVEAPGTLRLPFISGLPGASATVTFEFPYLAFRWQPKGDISTLALPTKGYLDLIQRLTVFGNMCRCVSRLHYLGCVHRDLKPPNFFLGSDNAVRLGDFGTTRLIGPKSVPLLANYTGPVGDVRYTAPEELAGIPLPPDVISVADIYSLGAILFELLTGHSLAAHAYGPINNIWAFAQYLRAVPDAQRRAVYEGYIVSRGHGMPDLRTINPAVPKCAAPFLTPLLQQLGHFDYRQRARNLVSAHRLIASAIIVLRHEARARRIVCDNPSLRQRDEYV